MRSINDLLGSVDQIRTAAAAAQEAVAAATAASAAAAAQAEQADTTVTEIQQEARTKISREFTTILRDLTAEVHQARQAAADAILNGTEPPLEAWLRYRRIRAANRISWQLLGPVYQATAGHRVPPGDWGPDVVAQHNGSLAVQVPAETFGDFLAAVTHHMEQQVAQEQSGHVLAQIGDR